MDEKEELMAEEQQLPGAPKEENKKQGKALKKWSTTMFVFSCIATALVVISLILPFFLILVGSISVIIWIIFLIFGSIITIGMMWLSDEVKELNSNWMAFNDKVFNSSNEIADKVLEAFPIMVIVGSVIFILAWLSMILGLVKDKDRKKRYTGLSIALGVLTVAFIAIAIVVLVNR